MVRNRFPKISRNDTVSDDGRNNVAQEVVEDCVQEFLCKTSPPTWPSILETLSNSA